MPKPLPPEKRNAIAKEFQTGKSAYRISKDQKVSISTVIKIAKEEGHSFNRADRSKTKNANETNAFDAKKARAELAQMMLEAAMDALVEMKQEYVVHHFTKEGEFVQAELKQPPASDKRNLMIVAATAIDKSIVIDRHDNGDSAADQAKAMLGQLGDMIFSNAVPRPKVSDERSAD